MTTSTSPRLKLKYQGEIKSALQTQLDIKNVMQVPTLEKIVINMGVGRATQQPSLLEGAVEPLFNTQTPGLGKKTRAVMPKNILNKKEKTIPL